MKDIVRPNLDTLYSFAFLDFSTNAFILSMPDTNQRYYLIQIMDAWTNVIGSLGKRTTGTKSLKFFLCGPNYKGLSPKELIRIDSPTNMAWILGRIDTNGPEDYDTVGRIQEQITLEIYNKTSENIMMNNSVLINKTKSKLVPIDKLMNMDVDEYYNTFSKLLQDNSPLKNDTSIVEYFGYLGVLEANFNYSSLNPFYRFILNAEYKLSNSILNSGLIKKFMKTNHGWMGSGLSNIGDYGTDYMTRALVAKMGFGANLPIDAIYPTAYFDTNDYELNGSNEYILRFNKSDIPVVNAFWSLAIYDKDSFLVPNEINRYSLRNTDDLIYSEDGSLTFYIQNTSPGVFKMKNWLPSPKEGKFSVTMRLYWPDKKILENKWTPPGIQKK